jgi:hypothetical protein
MNNIVKNVLAINAKMNTHPMAELGHKVDRALSKVFIAKAVQNPVEQMSTEQLLKAAVLIAESKKNSPKN